MPIPRLNLKTEKMQENGKKMKNSIHFPLYQDSNLKIIINFSQVENLKIK